MRDGRCHNEPKQVLSVGGRTAGDVTFEAKKVLWTEGQTLFEDDDDVASTIPPTLFL